MRPKRVYVRGQAYYAKFSFFAIGSLSRSHSRADPHPPCQARRRPAAPELVPRRDQRSLSGACPAPRLSRSVLGERLPISPQPDSDNDALRRAKAFPVALDDLSAAGTHGLRRQLSPRRPKSYIFEVSRLRVRPCKMFFAFLFKLFINIHQSNLMVAFDE
jgi:hypothetical protein